MVKISDRVSKILPSGTLAMTQKARKLKLRKKISIYQLVNLDLIHPEVITEAAVDALRKHETDHYTPALGIDKLRQAICDFHKRKDGIDLQKEQEILLRGAKFVPYLVL